MIVRCDSCQARFNFEERLIKAQGTAVRCSKCKHVFKVFALPSAAVAETTSPASAAKSHPDPKQPGHASGISDSIQIIDHAAVLSLPMEILDVRNCQEFKRQIEPLLATHSSLIFDLSALHFVDSSGCGIFLYCFQKLQEKDGQFQMCCASRQIRSIFRLMHLDRMVALSETRAEAIAAIRTG